MRRILLLLLLAAVSPLVAAPRRHVVSPDRCLATVSPASLSIPAAGGQATFSVSVAGGCSWSPLATDSWITVGAMGGVVSVDVPANPGSTPRTSLIHIRSAVVVVTQDATTNLLANGGFDSGTAGWSSAFSGGGSATPGTPSGIIVAPPTTSSSSVLITSTDPNGGYQLSQCVAVTGGKRYAGGTKTLIPSGQSSGVTNFAVFEYWVPSCTVSAGYHGSHVQVAASPIGTWFDNALVWNTDFATKSVLVVIGAGGSSQPPFSAWFDDVYLRENP